MPSARRSLVLFLGVLVFIRIGGFLGPNSLSNFIASTFTDRAGSRGTRAGKYPTAAVCHKTLFGPADLFHVARWAHYHYLLGFERIYIGYVPDMSSRPGFAALNATPYVQMIENTVGIVKRYGRNGNGYLRMEREKPGDQKWFYDNCVKDWASEFDWLFLADYDEYLYLTNVTDPSELVNNTVNTAPAHYVRLSDFLLQYEDLNYLSFGKYMYSSSQTLPGTLNSDQENDLFGVSKFPFTTKSFCNEPGSIGAPVCLRWSGRCKLLVRQPDFSHMTDNAHEAAMVEVPGDNVERWKAFHTAVAHVKEWPGIDFPDRPIAVRPAGQDFFVRSYGKGIRRRWAEADEHGTFFQPNVTERIKIDVGVHGFPNGYMAYRERPVPIWKVTYDDQLQGWLDFVASSSSSRSLV